MAGKACPAQAKSRRLTTGCFFSAARAAFLARRRSAPARLSLNGVGSTQGGIDNHSQLLPPAAVFAQYYDNSERNQNQSTHPASIMFSNSSGNYTANGGNSVTVPTISGGALAFSGGTMQVANSAGLVNPVQIETLPGLNVMVIKGSPTDVAEVEKSVRDGVQTKSWLGKQFDRTKDGTNEKLAWDSANSDLKPGEKPLAQSYSFTHTPASGEDSKADIERREQSLDAAIREKREEMKRKFGAISAGDDQAASLRGQMAINIAGEYRKELEKMEGEVSQLHQQIRSSSLPEADRLWAHKRYLTAKEASAELGKEIARVEAAGVKLATKKPLETWKPARVVPNASRLMVGEKEELPLKGMQVDVRVDGFRARVLLDLYYFNDRPQQLEGNFQLRLPDEAAPYFFAFGRTVYQAPQVTASDSMFFKPQQVSLGDTTPEKIMALRGNSWEQPKVARMVPKEKAAMAYRDTVRRRIDPALVEWSGAGVFQCRVFPLAPQSLHRITIGYDVDLVRVGDDLELRLDLPEWQAGGDAPATVVDLNVAAADARQVSLDAPSHAIARRAAACLSPGRSQAAAAHGAAAEAGHADAHRQRWATGNYFATRVTLPLGRQGAGSGEREQGAGRSEQASEAGSFPCRYLAERRAAVPLVDEDAAGDADNNRDQIKQFAVLFFNVETFWWQEKYVDNTPENVDAGFGLCGQSGPGRRDRFRPGASRGGRAEMAEGR